jgi:predicted DNA-binding transcriptional regulator AlpA
MPDHNQESKRVANRRWADLRTTAAYAGYSSEQFRHLIRAGIFPKPIYLTSCAKGMWDLTAIDACFEKAARSRKPGRDARGFVKQRLEAANA